ncbi:HU family DNA-binding protein [Mesoplasma melaleucae]|uniref:DNA-binding protein HU-beta n=1 Tax=Mesoplasma melaleucae TaxID=81459 RepID=A0A2K8P008_9MOLU|nr:HU family DNA-binding protein [Mesoplasma melaleucae]ATZ18331.1 hypothetical protein EMELA_v1c08470 [Mesoplasma melaleucae]
MNKKELIELIVQEHNLSKKWVKEIVDNIFNEIINALNDVKKVNINEFGISY